MTKILSSESHKNVGRPGFKGKIAGPKGKAGINRLMQKDPAKGITQPVADKITTTHIDLVGNQKSAVVGRRSNAAPHSGQKALKPLLKSPPVKR